MEYVLVALIALGLLLVAPILGIIAFLRTTELTRRAAITERSLGEAREEIAFLRARLDRSTVTSPPAAEAARTEVASDLAPIPDLSPVEDVAPTVPAAPAPARSGLVPKITGSADQPPPIIAEAASTPAWTSAPMPQAAAPAPTQTLEERLGSRWTVWVGMVALGLGALFLVRYSIEQGLLGPVARIAMGGLFSLALLGGGEVLRRRDIALPKLPVADIPAAVTAAGAVGLFGTVYAAHALYEFIGPATAFLLLGVVGIATMVLAGVHGPILGALGLIAAFAAPFLVESREPAPYAFHLYAAVVTASAITLAWVRAWPWLTQAAVIAGAGLGALVLIGSRGGEIWAIIQALLGLITLALLVVPGVRFVPPREKGIATLAAGCLAAFLALGGLGVIDGPKGLFDLALYALMAAAAIGLVLRSPSVDLTVPVAGLLTLLILLSWAVGVSPQSFSDPLGVPRDVPESLGQLTLASLVFAAILGAGPVAALFFRPYAEARPVLTLAATAATLPLTILVVLYGKATGFAPSPRFAALALLLAVIYGALTEALYRARMAHRPGLAGASAIFAVACLAAIALGLTLLLDKAWLTLALLPLPLAMAWVYSNRALPPLRIVEAIIGVLVAVRVLWDPVINSAPGDLIVLNWLLIGYGGAAASCFGAAWLLRERRGDDQAVQVLEGLALLLAALLVILEVRHAFGGLAGWRLDTPRGLSFAEAATHTVTALAFTLGLARLSLARSSAVIAYAASFARIATLAWIGVVMLLIKNPWVTGVVLGHHAIFNWALLGYGGGALLAILIAWFDRAGGREREAMAMAVAALLLGFNGLNLLIASLFRGPGFAGFSMGAGELYSYSAAWLAIGVALLFLGVRFASRSLRIGSAVLVGLAVLKVFLIDMGGLTGLWRALSFIGLGLVLMLVGRIYQRLLGRAPAPIAKAGP